MTKIGVLVSSKYEYTIVTNNPKVIKNFSNFYNIINSTDLYKVMSDARDLIHNGYKLITHPLSGSVKPVQSPYKSIVLKKESSLDFRSLEIWEAANEKVLMFKKNHVERKYPDEILADYQEIDFSLMSSAHKSILKEN